MVPQNSPPSPEPGPVLRPETLEALREIIAERWRALQDSEARLRAAVRAAAVDARERRVRPEELIIALKGIESDIFAQPGAMRAGDLEAGRRFREWVVTTCLDAYFEAES